jgi:3-isopropylmalate/(R)-2-methylmalate dehydratase small subunit
MKTNFKGRAFVFGNNLDTDQIYPGQYLELANTEDIKQHAMEGADPVFITTFQPGDIIVGGTNFGCGSSREHAAIALKAVGACAILAESFARIFYRNCINLGVPLLVSPGILNQVSQEDILEIDIETGKAQNLTTEQIFKFQPLSDYVLDILRMGGIKPLIKHQLQEMQTR